MTMVLVTNKTVEAEYSSHLFNHSWKLVAIDALVLGVYMGL